MAAEAALRTLIVDDEPLAAERLQILCAQLPAVAVVGTASDGEAALHLITDLQPDLILLDIAMPGLDGIAVAATLQNQANRPAVIFCTAFSEHAVAAFDVAATDYLLKPVLLDRLARAVARAAALPKTAAPPDRATEAFIRQFWVPQRHEMIRVLAEEVDWIEAERDYMRLHVGPRSYLLHHTISALEQRLDPEKFLRVHRSAIVRRLAVAKLRHDGVGTWHVVLGNGREIRIGRSYLTAAKGLAAP